MAWAYLIVAGLFEIAFAAALKASEGLTRFTPTLLFVTFSIVSFVLLSRAVTTIPIGTAYSVWTGIGAAGTVVIGIIAFGEPVGALRLFFPPTLLRTLDANSDTATGLRQKTCTSWELQSAASLEGGWRNTDGPTHPAHATQVESALHIEV